MMAAMEASLAPSKVDLGANSLFLYVYVAEVIVLFMSSILIGKSCLNGKAMQQSFRASDISSPCNALQHG